MMDFQLRMNGTAETALDVEEGNPVYVEGTVTDSKGNIPSGITSMAWTVSDRNGTAKTGCDGVAISADSAGAFDFLVPASANTLAAQEDEIRHVKVDVVYDGVEGSGIEAQVTKMYNVRNTHST